MNLDITGIQGDTGSPEEDVETKVINLARSRDIPLQSSDIDKCHRKGRYNPNKSGNRRVIVKFTNSKARELMFKSRKMFKKGIFIKDNLTPFRESLAYEARQLKREGKVLKTWVSGWKVFVLMPGEMNGRHIGSMEQIQAIRGGLPFPTK